MKTFLTALLIVLGLFFYQTHETEVAKTNIDQERAAGYQWCVANNAYANWQHNLPPAQQAEADRIALEAKLGCKIGNYGK